MLRRIVIGAVLFSWLGMGTALAQQVGRICDPCDPADLRSDMVVNSYWFAFGRRPNDAELRYWMSQPARDPRMASPDALLRNHLNWLRGASAEQWETARRALREALGGVAGMEQDPVIKNAVVDMMAGREGGGFRGLVKYLRDPGVRRYYVDLAQRASAAARPVARPVTQPAPQRPTPPQVQVQAPKTVDELGKLSLRLSPADIQKLLSLTVADPITTSNPLIGNAGAGLTANGGAALTQVEPFTMPIGNNFTMPIGNNLRSVQANVAPAQMVTDAFRQAFGRGPSQQELATWVDFKRRYPGSTVASSTANLAQALGYVLRLPAGEVQRQQMTRTAASQVFGRAAAASELQRWSERIRSAGMPFGQLVAAMRSEGAPRAEPAAQGHRPSPGGRHAQPPRSRG
ncbi:MAG: hypothetical protein A3K12_03440 [Candidatus Rokubacteria bacterium RIFCSPLOWO2_12_FULL_71_19]|nr:MAG: hypothetical protein A3K12_03440 [Candidatus Rokubacteria bacterium RIFCSPLOWO2_12_FULL_71_19]